MSLWSASILKSSSCPRRSLRLRQGMRGRPWSGFRVGTFVHRVLHQKGVGGPPPEDSSLSVLEMAEADKLLENAELMGLPASYPASAVYEQDYMLEVLDTGLASRVAEAPDWAIRGEHWDPAKAGDGTFFRLQPDVWYLDPDGTLCIDDYKTALGMSSDSSVARDPQVVTYAAALCLYTGATSCRVTLWNVRWTQGQQVQRTAEEWVEDARRLWHACFRADRLADDEVDADYRPETARCGTCPFFQLDNDEAGCFPPEELGGPEDLYRAAKLCRVEASSHTARLRSILKQRTSVKLLSDGTILGPHQRTGLRWQREKKRAAIRLAIRELVDEGAAVEDYFVPAGPSLLKWFEGLPERTRAALEPFAKESLTTIYTTQGSDEFIESLANTDKGDD